jgi:hypothetical protein
MNPFENYVRKKIIKKGFQGSFTGLSDLYQTLIHIIIFLVNQNVLITQNKNKIILCLRFIIVWLI